MTDNAFHDVGTLVTAESERQSRRSLPARASATSPERAACRTRRSLQSVPNPANDGGFNTPTVLGLYFAPPYFHDGSAATLNDVIPRMAAGAGLPPFSASDSADLVAYLQTL